MLFKFSSPANTGHTHICVNALGLVARLFVEKKDDKFILGIKHHQGV